MRYREEAKVLEMERDTYVYIPINWASFDRMYQKKSNKKTSTSFDYELFIALLGKRRL